jgi:shikimate kinase
VYLIGFMGSGKSTIGPILANTIGYDFLDVDRIIEGNEGMSIREIFQSKGEEHFRRCEREIVRETCTRSRIVVSLGGGAVVDPESFRQIKTAGVVVYLKLTPEQIFQRLRNKSDRPMLLGPTGEKLAEEDLRVRILRLYREREQTYALADIVLQTDESKLGLTVDRLVKKLSGHIA